MLGLVKCLMSVDMYLLRLMLGRLLRVGVVFLVM